MNAPHESSTTCDACARDDGLDPHENAAALPQIDYRLGNYSRFLQRMLGSLSRPVVQPGDVSARLGSLAALTTRATDEPVLALMDAWACTLDVLSFYQERIANEGFLRTATERRSVLELARAIGYELAPGVAASARLAFTLLDTPKAPREVPLPSGLQVQSVPGPGELPQLFETVEEVLARPEWNAMRPAQRQTQLVAGMSELYLVGLSTGLKLGDSLLFVGQSRLQSASSSSWDVLRVLELDLDREQGITWLRLDGPIAASSLSSAQPPRIFAFARRASLFGNSAPDPRLFSGDMKAELGTLLNIDDTEWEGLTIDDTTATERTAVVQLVGEIDQLVPGGWLLFEQGTVVVPCAALGVQFSSRVDFGLSLKTTRVVLDQAATSLVDFTVRRASVHVVSRELTLATAPIADELFGDEIVLDSSVPLLESGRAVFVKGPTSDAPAGPDAVEVALVDEAVTEQRFGAERTVLRLTAPLAQRFDRAGCSVLANVARSTHGKTIAREVLGAGDGAKAFQSFALRQQPLTYCSNPGEGTASTLVVRVGGVEWTPVASTFQQPAEARVYVPRIDNAGVTSLTFGDGVNGARLPTGVENVTAHYRAGLGHSGAVPAERLTVLKTRPQGVKAVTNPLAAVGAQDAEAIEDARGNAPVTVLTLDRLVSVRDYEDYARAYPGIGKAQAVRLWDGRRFFVHLTLATAEGAPLLPSDDLYQSLTADIDARRDPVQRLSIGTFSDRRFELTAKLRIDAAYITDDVIDEVATTLRAAFAFSARRFGQVVTGSEILKLAHRVKGVVAIDLDDLAFTDGGPTSPLSGVSSSWVLPAFAARWGESGLEPAELLLLDSAEQALDLREVRG